MLVCPKCGLSYTREQEHCGLDGTKLVKSESDPLIGQTIDKYRIEGRLGSGGMATVYRARHQFLDKNYAVKVLHGQIAADATMARRFHREAKTLGQIKHPNVVSVDNFGVTETGLLFMVMEYLDGLTLSQMLRSQGALAPARAADFVRQIATGLQAAHRKGFVHRDLKPGNVMLVNDEVIRGPQGETIVGEAVKLMDFGLVRIVSDDDGHTQLTQSGQFFGTPMYMAPEQISGTPPVGPATDLYSLGVILHQMLAGKPPFTGDIKRLAFQHVQNEPPKLESSFGGLSALSRHLMAKAPDDRPADAGAVVSAIDELALTPASQPPAPLARGPSLVGDADDLPPEADEPEFQNTLDFGLDGPEHALSRSVIEEERAFQTALEADREMLQQSVDAAVGRKRRGRSRWLVALALLIVGGGAAGLYYANGQSFDLETLKKRFPVLANVLGPSADLSPKPHPKPATVSAAKNKKPSAQPKAKARTKASQVLDAAENPKPVEAPAQAAQAVEPVAPVEPTPAPTPADAGFAVDAGPPRSFEELEKVLAQQLKRRGLSLSDVNDVDHRSADRWLAWREAHATGDDLPARRRLEKVFGRLEAALQGLVVNEALIGKKLERVGQGLPLLKLHGSTEHEALQKRFATTKRAFERKPRKKHLEAIAADLSRLERDVLAADARAIQAQASETADAGTDI